MNTNKVNRGSEWRKWDLHIHTPLSICQDYGGDSEEVWENFITSLEQLPHDVKVIGITDYYFIDGYEKIMEYKEAIKILEKHKKEFEEQNIFFGMDLGSEHEKFIAEKVVNGPVAMINYPKDIKAFYMYQNDDKKTVAAFDLLVPGIGEIIGGSQRESRYELLVQRLKELKIKQEPLQ